MKMGNWARILPVTALLMAGCGDFWEAPNSSSTTGFSLSNSGNISVSPGATTGNTATITVTPGSSFTGTVTLTCAVTAPAGASSPTTCSLSSSSLTFSNATALSTTLTASTTSSTTTGAYQITVTGVSGSVSESTTVCVAVGTGSCSSTASTSGNFYILNSSTTSSSSIAGYYISSGKLNAISGGSVTVNGTAYSVAMAPDGKFLCVSSTAGVYAYPITNGALGTGVQVTQDQAYAIQVDRASSNLLEAIPATGGVTFVAVPISPTTGAYIVGSTLPTVSFTVTNAAVQPNKMVISDDNAKIFLPLGAGGTIIVAFDGTPTFQTGINAITIPVANTGGSALSVAVGPGAFPNLFYIGETLAGSGGTTGGLRAFTYASLSTSPLSLVQATGSPIASDGLAPNFILPFASPSYVYVANGAGVSSAGNVTGFAVTTTALTTGSTVAAGAQPVGMAVDSTGDFVLVVNNGGSTPLSAFTFDTSTTGKLDTASVSGSLGANPIAIVAVP